MSRHKIPVSRTAFMPYELVMDDEGNPHVQMRFDPEIGVGLTRRFESEFQRAGMHKADVILDCHDANGDPLNDFVFFPTFIIGGATCSYRAVKSKSAPTMHHCFGCWLPRGIGGLNVVAHQISGGSPNQLVGALAGVTIAYEKTLIFEVYFRGTVKINDHGEFERKKALAGKAKAEAAMKASAEMGNKIDGIGGYKVEGYVAASSEVSAEATEVSSHKRTIIHDFLGRDPYNVLVIRRLDKPDKPDEKK